MEKSMSKTKKSRLPGRKTLFYCCMVALPVLQFVIFYIFVNINSILLSFKDISKVITSNGALRYEEKFVGFSTLAEVFSILFGAEMGVVWKNTFVSYAVGLLFGTTLSLLFSYYIFKKFVGSSVFKVVLFLPQVVSGLVLIVMYRYFVVDVLGAIFPGIPDLLDVSNNSAFYTVLVFTVWTGFGTTVMMYVGAMNNISESILEYAKIDGVSAWQEFVHIVLPMVYPTLITFIVVGLASAFTNQMRLFDFYGSDAERYLQTIGYYMYAGVQKAGADLTKYPYFAAMGLILTFITVPVVLTVKWLLQKFGPKVD